LSQPARASCSVFGSFSSVRFLTPSQQSQVVADLDTEVLARDDGVEVAELEVALRGAETCGQFLMGGLLDDARPGEVEPRARLRDADVGERRETGHHAAGARVGEDGHKR
jgi:hypothetical protein